MELIKSIFPMLYEIQRKLNIDRVLYNCKSTNYPGTLITLSSPIMKISSGINYNNLIMMKRLMIIIAFTIYSIVLLIICIVLYHTRINGKLSNDNNK